MESASMSSTIAVTRVTHSCHLIEIGGKTPRRSASDVVTGQEVEAPEVGGSEPVARRRCHLWSWAETGGQKTVVGNESGNDPMPGRTLSICPLDMHTQT
jgi:hypothetical protein